MDEVQVVWFKRDLRVGDHAPLASAARRGPVLPLYVVEPGLLRRPDHGPAHWTFVRESLRELRAALAALGQPLIVRVGEPVAVLRALRAVVPFAALWAHEETGVEWTFARDRAVRRWAAAAGIPFAELPQGGVTRGYAGRYPDRAAWGGLWERAMRGPLVAPPAALRPVPGLSPGPIPTHQQLGLPPDERAPVVAAGLPNVGAGGEAAGRALLASFLGGRGAGYGAAMSGPNSAPDACSRLGPHLAWGTISLRAATLASRESWVVGRERGDAPLLPPELGNPLVATHDSRLTTHDLRPFLARLRWRSHFVQKLEDAGRIERESLVAPYDELRAVELGALAGGPGRAERLAAWRAGRTGYPLVDACMRALRATGWLPFRMRAMLVSFAAYDLWLPWQDFSDGLARLWLDYEPGIHLCQVQMQSGVTAGDALRVYDPTKQATEHDPAGTFIRRWVPELRRVPHEHLHRPWTLPPEAFAAAGCRVGQDYPLPLVDHEVAGRAARAALAEFRRRPDVAAAIATARARHSDPRQGVSRPDAAARRRARGQLPLFTTSGTQTVTVTNGGGAALTINSLTITGTDPADFLLTGDTCSGQQLAPGVSCTFGVAFRPTAVGARQAQVTVVSTVGTVNLLLSGTGISPAVGLSAASLDFGPQPVGTQSAARTVTLTNNGNSSLTITSVTFGGDNPQDFVLTADACSGVTVAPGGTCTFSVAFKPTAVGPRTATAIITDSAPGSPRTVLLSGQGTTASVGLSSSNLQFGNQAVGTTSAAQTLTITNNGGTTVTIASIVPGGANPGDFILSGDTCTGATIPAGQSCQVGVSFRPTAAGTRAATLTITDNAAGSPRTVILGGTGIANGFQISAGSLNFGVQPVGVQGETQILTITNGGSTAVSISATALSGAAAGDFILYANSCLGATIPAGATCQIGVAFKPTAVGNRSATLTITDTAPGSPHTVALNGIGVTAGIAFSTPGMDFGAVQVGTQSAPQTLTLTNNSGGAVTFTTAIGGLAQGDYIKSLDTCNNATLGPGGTCQISIRFAPTTSGSRPALLGITVAGGTTYALGLNGIGVSGQVSFNPTTIDFGGQPLTTQSGFQTITVTNGGNGSLSISDVVLAGTNPGDFVLNNTGCKGATLAPNGTCQVSVSFKPTAAGSRSATVVFSTNVGGGTQTVALVGTGTTAPAPVISVNPTGLTFAPQQVGTQSGVQTVTISNTGTANLVLGPVSLTGANQGDFTKGNDTCSGATIAPNTSCTIAVRFTPQGGGTRVAALSFTSNATSGAQTVSITGIGTTPAVHLDTTSVNFGGVQVGTTAPTKTVTLTNSGTGELVITSTTIGGVNAGDYAKAGDTCTGAILAPGATCTIGIAFSPLTTGARAGTLLINDNAPGAPHSLPLTGEGTVAATPSVQLSATALSFGPVQLGQTSQVQNLTITNSGGGTLTIAGAQISNGNAGDFSKTGDTCTGKQLGAGQSCTVGILFTPGAAGARTSALLVIDTAIGSPRTVTLSGVGVTGAVGLGAASLQFGTQTVGTSSAAQTLTVTNTGLGILTLGPVTLGGAHPGDWGLVANTCEGATIPGGQSCQIGVVFKPTAEGDRGATLQIVNTAAGSTHIVALNGIGGPVAPYYGAAVVVPGVGGTATITPAPLTNGKYQAGTEITLRATPLPDYIFIGWVLNGQKVGWANPLTVTVNSDIAAEAQFAPRANFNDTAGTPYLTAIRELTGRGIIRGYGDGNFGPSDTTLRAQMAALIARAMDWDREDHGNRFTDRNGVDADLWRNVGTLAYYNVARGYRDDTYDPTGKVLYAQTISFITRAMVAKGYWTQQPDVLTIYPNVPIDSGHREDIVTYVYYVGALPGTSSPTGDFPNWDQASPREWFAESLWRALNSYFGVDRVP